MLFYNFGMLMKNKHLVIILIILVILIVVGIISYHYVTLVQSGRQLQEKLQHKAIDRKTYRSREI